MSPLALALFLWAAPGTTPAGAPALSFDSPADAVAAVRWNSFARRLALHGKGESFRVYALLSLAQLHALRSVLAGHEAEAVVAASSALLAGLFPDHTDQIAAKRKKELAGVAPDSVAVRLGDAIAAAVLAMEGTAAPPSQAPSPENPPQNPTNGKWISAPGRSPVGEQIPLLLPFVLRSVAQLRPDPPPQPGSKVFEASLEGVRKAVRARTADQLAAAEYWAGGRTGEVTPGLWNGLAAWLIGRKGLSEVQAVRALAILNLAMHDAAIGCFEAKYHYRFLRPSQADPKIRPGVALPNFPSYPSAHACFSGAAEVALAAAMPDEKPLLEGLADEAINCRVWAGLHYDFDGKAGRMLGRQAAALVIEQLDRL